MKRKSWRHEIADRLDRLAGLSPEAVGVGVPIDRTQNPAWRNTARTDAHKCAESAPDMTNTDLQRPDPAL